MYKRRKPAGPKPKKVYKYPNLAGLYPRNFPRCLRWKLEMDDQYWEDLKNDPMAAKWLADFNDEFHQGDFNGPNKARWPKEQRSRVNQAKKASRRDAYTLAALDKKLRPQEAYAAPSAELWEIDGGHTPAYLDDPLYKQAREEFRETLNPHLSNYPPVETPEYHRRRAKLEKLTPTSDLEKLYEKAWEQHGLADPAKHRNHKGKGRLHSLRNKDPGRRGD